MARSAITRNVYRYKVLHAINETKKTSDLPSGIVNEWIHDDICEAVLRLGGLINHLYRKVVVVALSDALGVYEATATHVAAATEISGFSGLDVAALAGGSIMAVVSDVLEAGQIVTNGVDTITLVNGSSMSAFSGVPVIASVNQSLKYADLTTQEMIWYNEPIWSVTDGSGEPIELMDLETARNIQNDPFSEDERYWYLLGQHLNLALGSSASISGNLNVGLYGLPVKPTLDTEYIDLPGEWQDLPMQRTIIRILKKLEFIDKAQEREVDLERRWQAIEKGNLTARSIDFAAKETSTV